MIENWRQQRPASVKVIPPRIGEVLHMGNGFDSEMHFYHVQTNERWMLSRVKTTPPKVRWYKRLWRKVNGHDRLLKRMYQPMPEGSASFIEMFNNLRMEEREKE